jgi:hypothetical protein
MSHGVLNVEVKRVLQPENFPGTIPIASVDASTLPEGSYIRVQGGQLVQYSQAQLVDLIKQSITYQDVSVSGVPAGSFFRVISGVLQPVSLQDVQNALSGLTKYEHVQSEPSSLWLVNHNLSAYPFPVTTTSLGSVIRGAVEYPSRDSIEIRFGAALSGFAYLLS